MQNLLRQLPSVDELLRSARVTAWIEDYGHDAVTEALRQAIEAVRQRMIATGSAYPGEEELLRLADAWLALLVEPTLRPVINATGVIIHTNLGRAPLSDEVLAAMRAAGEGYSNLEFDLELGRRGSRYVHAEALLCRLTGAEAALLVNNNAGAVLLVLSALARGREVIISRGQLVEIGGGFRIPEVMAQSGARLVEVGTTNRTYVRDYADAIRTAPDGEGTAALMRVHSSNFRIIGFSAMPSLEELVALAHERGLWLFDDLGSGTLLDTEPFGLAHEPMVQESVRADADLITFSGDKLLGGPQAGIIVGKKELVARLRRHPLTRALRVDKTTIAGIQANLLHYVKGEAPTAVPIWRMIAMTQAEIEARARVLLDALGSSGAGCELLPGRSMVGGGSLPEESLPTTLLALPDENATELARSLRLGRPAVVARIQEGHVVLDLRTVLPRQEEALLARLREVL
ncbi:MAG: L-seryl-tRNA(Sec) selenium transferase [Chloroflexi bacterium]|nr:L-seryl-tRNA(Sec) selenium transferase [Chloroflexota bacterium]